MKFLSKVKLSNRRYKTPEGYLVCVDSIIARTGKQEYLKSEIFQDSKDDSVIQIDRPKSEVLSPSTIASFENKPLVDEHPDEDVNVDNYRDYAIGFARDVRGSKLDDVDILIANLIFTDPEAIAEIESGEKTELSCGYDCDILGEGDNLYQANIRGNHIALCKAGRAGIARIQDSKMKDSKIKLSRQNALDIFEDIEDDIPWYNSKYNCRFDLNDNYLIIEGNRKNLENIIKEYRLADYNVKIIDSCTSKETQEVVDSINDVNIKNRKTRLLKIFKKYNYNRDDAIAEVNNIKGITEDEIAELVDWITDIYKDFNNLKDSGYSEKLKDLSPEERSKKIDELIADEIEAIDGYKEAMKYADEADKSIYSSIIAEELKHIIELKALKNENFKELKDSNIKDIEKKEFTYNGFDVYLVGRTSDDAHYEIRYKGKGVASCDYSEDPKKEIDKLNTKVVTIYGITTERKWDMSHGRAKPERTFTSLSEAQYEQKKLEKEDGIPYVIFIEKEITYINNKKFFEDEENKKMRDGALRGIHLKKIRNTLRNEDEDLVEDFLDYMDTRPDLVKEYDDYSDYMVREDFETWKKYKKIKTRDVDTYKEVTEDLEKELKDSKVKDSKKLLNIIKLYKKATKDSINKKEVEKAINNLGYTVKKWYTYGSDNVAIIDDKYIKMDGYPYFNQQVKKLKRFDFANDIYVDDNEIVFEGAKFNIKDSKVKDSMTKVNIETSLSIFDLQKAARKFDVIVILSNYTDHVYAILKGEKEDIGDLLSYLDNKGVLMKYPKGF